MNTHVNKTKEKQGLPHAVSPKEGNGGTFQFVDQRPATDHTLQLQAMMHGTFDPEKQIIQRYPKKNKDNEEFLDSDYPGLVLLKLEKYGEYRIKGTQTVLYYEPGEGYYVDELLKQKADMSAYIDEARPGIANLGGKSYDFYEDKVVSGYFTIEAALDILERFGKIKESNRNIDKDKVANILEEFKQRRPVHPIEVRRGEDGYDLIQGRHRIYASYKAGFTMIPYNIK